MTELHSFITAEFGASVLDTHDWRFTPGSGVMLQHLLGAVSPAERGAVLPSYQAVAASLTPGETRTSAVVEPTDWARAAFRPPAHTPTVMVVNSLHANPLAVSLPAAFLTDLGEYAHETGVLLIEDDAFRGTGAVDDQAPTLLGAYPVVHLGSWTKLLGWPTKLGFVGWPRGHPMAGGLRESAPAVAAATLAQLTATMASGVTDTIRLCRRNRLARRRADVVNLLTDLGIPFLQPTGGAHIAILTEGDEGLRQTLLVEGVGGLAWSSFYPPGAGCPSNPFLRLGISNVAETDWVPLRTRLARALTNRTGPETQ